MKYVLLDLMDSYNLRKDPNLITYDFLELIDEICAYFDWDESYFETCATVEDINDTLDEYNKENGTDYMVFSLIE